MVVADEIDGTRWYGVWFVAGRKLKQKEIKANIRGEGEACTRKIERDRERREKLEKEG
jgi:hypothetical protein